MIQTLILSLTDWLTNYLTNPLTNQPTNQLIPLNTVPIAQLFNKLSVFTLHRPQEPVVSQSCASCIQPTAPPPQHTHTLTHYSYHSMYAPSSQPTAPTTTTHTHTHYSYHPMYAPSPQPTAPPPQHTHTHTLTHYSYHSMYAPSSQLYDALFQPRSMLQLHKQIWIFNTPAVRPAGQLPPLSLQRNSNYIPAQFQLHVLSFPYEIR
jgi:hypothetical protein